MDNNLSHFKKFRHIFYDFLFQINWKAELLRFSIKMDFTQKQLAEKTGIYQADISKIKRELNNPSIGTLQRLADGMGLQIEINFK